MTERCFPVQVLADEAEVNDDDVNALKYHRQRVVVAAKSVEAWYDLGAFCSRSGERGQAEEALREALLLDPAHMPATVALALLHMAAEEWERAEIYAQVGGPDNPP